MDENNPNPWRNVEKGVYLALAMTIGACLGRPIFSLGLLILSPVWRFSTSTNPSIAGAVRDSIPAFTGAIIGAVVWKAIDRFWNRSME